MHLERFFLEGLGHTSYLLGSHRSGEAAVVDPCRDVEGYLEAAERAGLRIRYVLETHVHDDLLSGARALVARTGADHVASADAGLRYRHLGASEGCVVRLGELEVAVLATPGHTLEHVSYVVIDAEQEDAVVAVFTGGALLAGGVGWVSALGPDRPERLAEQLAEQLYASIFGKLLALPVDAPIFPTHGLDTPSTIGQAIQTSPALRHSDRAAFVAHVLATERHPVRQARRLRRLNQIGVEAHVPAPTTVISPADVRFALDHGAAIVDTRTAERFGASHVAGAINIALGPTLPTWAGEIFELETPLILVLADPDAWTPTVTALARVGFDHVVGLLPDDVLSWLVGGLPIRRVEQIEPAELAPLVHAGDVALLDVRTRREWQARRVPGAQHIPLAELPARIPEIAIDRPLAVLCGSGYRSSIAASLLAPRLPFRVLNVAGGLVGWTAGGLPLDTRSDRVEQDRAAPIRTVGSDQFLSC
jgi:hydroxyacylglutathione hydrolase